MRIQEIMKSNQDVRFLTGFGQRKWGQYHQGNRVYDSKCIACCVTASPVGGMGGNTTLYLVSKGKDESKIDNTYEPNTDLDKKGYELVNFCELDKFASKSYCTVHGESPKKNLGDITKVDENEIAPFNMICGGSPCQDFSVAGKQAGSKWVCEDCGHEYNPLTVHYSERNHCPSCGGEHLNKSRSSLLVEWLRVIRANRPKWGIYENVKNIVGKQFRETFQMFLDELHEYGYNTYYKVLNAKDYGIPQNRERVYLIIVLKELDNGKFVFPEPFDNGIRLKDVLEDEVDKKYYINTERAKELILDLQSSGKLDRIVSNTVRGGGRSSLDRHQWDLISE